jgi:hypothetical protein
MRDLLSAVPVVVSELDVGASVILVIYRSVVIACPIVELDVRPASVCSDLLPQKIGSRATRKVSGGLDESSTSRKYSALCNRAAMTGPAITLRVCNVRVDTCGIDSTWE